MEQKNEQIRQTLISQYSKLTFLSVANLTERMQQTEWWNKEQNRLNTHQKVTLVVISFVIMSFLFIALVSFSRGSVPLLSFIFFPFGVFLSQWAYTRIEERSRIYKLMCLAFDRNR